MDDARGARRPAEAAVVSSGPARGDGCARAGMGRPWARARASKRYRTYSDQPKTTCQPPRRGRAGSYGGRHTTGPRRSPNAVRCFRIGPLADADGLCLLRRAATSTARQALPWSLPLGLLGWLRDGVVGRRAPAPQFFPFHRAAAPLPPAWPPQPLVGRAHAAPWAPRPPLRPSLDEPPGPLAASPATKISCPPWPRGSQANQAILSPARPVRPFAASFGFDCPIRAASSRSSSSAPAAVAENPHETSGQDADAPRLSCLYTDQSNADPAPSAVPSTRRLLRGGGAASLKRYVGLQPTRLRAKAAGPGIVRVRG